ncbi:hypothetical protein [Dyella flagellata]|uniref:hypothetical protein n=1 Tax=Dyella flagellata TaxID=1867833 RepID=UPI0024E0D496|nr:hypothetical protein [Dyella flagellata]
MSDNCDSAGGNGFPAASPCATGGADPRLLSFLAAILPNARAACLTAFDFISY